MDPETFREALAGVCTPVSVVTSHREGRPPGTTVSAFCSLSLEPPMVLVSLDRRSDLLAIVSESRVFGINVLNHGQQALALNFARKGTSKFDGVEWELDRGVPRIAGAATWLVCKLEQLHEGGDHLIAVGLVEHAESGPGNPLLYRRHEFGTLARISEGDRAAPSRSRPLARDRISVHASSAPSSATAAPRRSPYCSAYTNACWAALMICAGTPCGAAPEPRPAARSARTAGDACGSSSLIFERPSVATIAPSTATPKVPPTMRFIERMPDATPALACATEFIAAVLIGDITNAIPIPISTKPGSSAP